MLRRREEDGRARRGGSRGLCVAIRCFGERTSLSGLGIVELRIGRRRGETERRTLRQASAFCWSPSSRPVARRGAARCRRVHRCTLIVVASRVPRSGEVHEIWCAHRDTQVNTNTRRANISVCRRSFRVKTVSCLSFNFSPARKAKANSPIIRYTQYCIGP